MPTGITINSNKPGIQSLLEWGNLCLKKIGCENNSLDLPWGVDPKGIFEN
jgi:hypothetical protein